MQCTNCGKEVPFTGKVCPYCNHSKTEKKMDIVLATIGVALGVLFGWSTGGGWFGAVVSAVVGLIGSVFVGIWWRGRESKKQAEPRATEPRPAPRESAGTADRLAHLDELKKKGLISDVEYDKKRQEVLSSI